MPGSGRSRSVRRTALGLCQVLVGEVQEQQHRIPVGRDGMGIKAAGEQVVVKNCWTSVENDGAGTAGLTMVHSAPGSSGSKRSAARA